MTINNFYNNNHKSRFLSLLESEPRIQRSTEYAAAFYMLSSLDTLQDKYLKHVSNIGIDFQGIFEEEVLSSGESAIIAIAQNLFNGNELVDLNEMYYLDKEAKNVVIEAIKIRFEF